MITVLSDQPEQLKRFRVAPWRCQQTFKTPLKSLDTFTASVLGLFASESCALDTDLIVFEPDNFLLLLAKQSITVSNRWKLTLRADGTEAIAELLQAALGDWSDFLFMPTPESFAIYADHDEWTTFYTHDLPTLNLIKLTLENAEFVSVPNYKRGGMSERWR